MVGVVYLWLGIFMMPSGDLVQLEFTARDDDLAGFAAKMIGAVHIGWEAKGE